MLVAGYVISVAAANISIAMFGPGAAPVNAFLLIGLNLTTRDILHDKWSGRGLYFKMAAMMVAAGALAYAVDGGTARISLASLSAILLSGASDTATYQRFIRSRYIVRVNASNAVSGAVDSVAFFLIAFGSLHTATVISMWAAKLAGGAIWSLALSRARH